MEVLKYLLVFSVLVCSCNTKPISGIKNVEPVKVALNTERGTIILELSDKTPVHRDNFVKLVNSGYFNGMLFHRVILNFGIQSGDPDSKTAKPGQALGNSDTGYTLPSEINDELFHRRGALNAARENNPDRASSGSQFFIVQGKVHTDNTLAIAEKRINQMLARYYYINDPQNKVLRDSIAYALKIKSDSLQEHLAKELNLLAKDYTKFKTYSIPEQHRKIYKTEGGNPHLDQNYTVFGQVIKGMEVVDSIAAMPTDKLDRPLKDIRIITAEINK